jgi:SAM-dependent methyltransferase
MTDLQDIYDDEFYKRQADESYLSAKIVLPVVFNQVGIPKSIIDIGCGVGTWLIAAKELVPDASILGIDHPRDNFDKVRISREYFLGRDLSSKIELNRKFGLVISLEVAEHLYPEFADTFVENLVRHSDLILFSSAIPGQGGLHHVNEQFPFYWIDKFKSYGFVCYDTVRPEIWSSDRIEFWYRQNILIFSKQRIQKLEGLKTFYGEALVHPLLIGLCSQKTLWQSLKIMGGKLLRKLGISRRK